jgi:hypothetical protein
MQWPTGLLIRLIAKSRFQLGMEVELPFETAAPPQELWNFRVLDPFSIVPDAVQYGMFISDITAIFSSMSPLDKDRAMATIELSTPHQQRRERRVQRGAWVCPHRLLAPAVRTNPQGRRPPCSPRINPYDPGPRCPESVFHGRFFFQYDRSQFVPSILRVA